MSTATSRERMVLTAERLFSERGIGAVSLREIGAAAGQRNSSAAQYHFETKAGLVNAVFTYRMAAIDLRRRAMLAEIQADGRGDDLRAIVEALVIPFAESVTRSEGPSYYARFLAHYMLESGLPGVYDAQNDDVSSGMRQLVAAFQAALSFLPARVLAFRGELALEMMVYAMARYEGQAASSERPRATPSPTVFISDLVDVIVALLSGPVTPRAKGRRRSTSR